MERQFLIWCLICFRDNRLRNFMHVHLRDKITNNFFTLINNSKSNLIKMMKEL